MKKLFFVRHGETEMNINRILSGNVETALTETGRAQAKNAGKLMKGKPKIDLIISSPLSRAYDTARYIAKGIEYPIDKIQKDPLFIERSFGELEGTSADDFAKTNTFEDLDTVKDAESTSELHERALKALEYLKSLPQDNILVVSHGSFGRALRRVIENIPYHHEYSDKHREKYRIGNAEIVELI